MECVNICTITLNRWSSLMNFRILKIIHYSTDPLIYLCMYVYMYIGMYIHMYLPIFFSEEEMLIILSVANPLSHFLITFLTFFLIPLVPCCINYFYFLKSFFSLSLNTASLGPENMPCPSWEPSLNVTTLLPWAQVAGLVGAQELQSLG